MSSKVVVSSAMAIIVANSLASFGEEDRVNMDRVFDNIDERLVSDVEVAINKRATSDIANLMFIELSSSMARDGLSLRERHPEEFSVANSAGNQDSTDLQGISASSCYSNCHSNCHSACHGSRGWR